MKRAIHLKLTNKHSQTFLTLVSNVVNFFLNLKNPKVIKFLLNGIIIIFISKWNEKKFKIEHAYQNTLYLY